MNLKRFVGANWKMHSAPKGFGKASSPYHSTDHCDVVVFPTALDIDACVAAGLATGGQYGRSEEGGSFTGDVSMRMLKAHGCTHVLCGHSERRQHHEESDATVAAQTAAALGAGLTAVVCIGESADQHELGMTQNVVQTQLSAVLDACKGLISAKNTVIAYEPVWAIGTGKTPSPAEADAVHAFIRGLLPDPEIRIIYGGSLSAKNAADFFACDNIQGGLIGGASLKPDEFHSIVTASAKSGVN